MFWLVNYDTQHIFELSIKEVQVKSRHDMSLDRSLEQLSIFRIGTLARSSGLCIPKTGSSLKYVVPVYMQNPLAYNCPL